MYRTIQDKYAFKVVSPTLQSFRGTKKVNWHIGEENRITNHKALKACKNGFHCSNRMNQAIYFGHLLSHGKRSVVLLLVKIPKGTSYLESHRKTVTKRLIPIAAIKIRLNSNFGPNPISFNTHSKYRNKLLKQANLNKNILGRFNSYI